MSNFAGQNRSWSVACFDRVKSCRTCRFQGENPLERIRKPSRHLGQNKVSKPRSHAPPSRPERAEKIFLCQRFTSVHVYTKLNPCPTRSASARAPTRFSGTPNTRCCSQLLGAVPKSGYQIKAGYRTQIQVPRPKSPWACGPPSNRGPNNQRIPDQQLPDYQSPDYQSPDYQSPDYQSPGCQSPGCQSPGCHAHVRVGMRATIGRDDRSTTPAPKSKDSEAPTGRQIIARGVSPW